MKKNSYKTSSRKERRKRRKNEEQEEAVGETKRISTWRFNSKKSKSKRERQRDEKERREEGKRKRILDRFEKIPVNEVKSLPSLAKKKGRGLLG